MLSSIFGTPNPAPKPNPTPSKQTTSQIKSNATNYLIGFLSKKAKVYDPEFVILPSDDQTQIKEKTDKKETVQKILIDDIKKSIADYLKTTENDINITDVQNYANQVNKNIEEKLITFIKNEENATTYKVLIDRINEIEGRDKKQGGKRKSKRTKKSRKNNKSRKNRRRRLAS
jgi:DNA-binding protein Fis